MATAFTYTPAWEIYRKLEIAERGPEGMRVLEIDIRADMDDLGEVERLAHKVLALPHKTRIYEAPRKNKVVCYYDW